MTGYFRDESSQAIDDVATDNQARTNTTQKHKPAIDQWQTNWSMSPTGSS